MSQGNSPLGSCIPSCIEPSGKYTGLLHQPPGLQPSHLCLSSPVSSTGAVPCR